MEPGFRLGYPGMHRVKRAENEQNPETLKFGGEEKSDNDRETRGYNSKRKTGIELYSQKPGMRKFERESHQH